MHGAARYFPGLAEEGGPAVLDHDIAAVRDGVEAVAVAVREGHVFKEPFPVDYGVPYLIVVRHQVDVREAEAAQPAPVRRVYGLSGKLRMGIDQIGTVHAAGAAAHDHAVKALQQLPEADFMDKTVLRGHVSAAEDYPMRTRHKLRGLCRIAPVQHHDFRCVDAGVPYAGAHPLKDGVREGDIIGGGAYHEDTGARGQFGHQAGKESVVCREVVLPVPGGASGKKECHYFTPNAKMQWLV